MNLGQRMAAAMDEVLDCGTQKVPTTPQQCSIHSREHTNAVASARFMLSRIVEEEWSGPKLCSPVALIQPVCLCHDQDADMAYDTLTILTKADVSCSVERHPGHCALR